MAGAGLAALANLLGGLSTGAYKGYDAGLEDVITREKLAETARHNKAVEEPLTTDVGTLYKTLGVTPPAAADTSARIPTSLGTHAAATIEREAAAKRGVEQANQLGAALENNNFGPPASQVPVSANAPGMLAPDAPTRDPEIAALGGVARVEPGKSVTALTEILKGRQRANTGLKQETRDINGRQYRITFDANGNEINRVDLGPQREGIGPLQRSDVKRAMQEAGWTEDMPGYGSTYFDAVKQIPVPGRGVFTGSQIIPPPRAGAAPQPVAGTGAEPRAAEPRFESKIPLPAAETATLADFRTLRSMMKRIEDQYNKTSGEFVGPAQGRLGWVREKTGIGSSAEEANLRSEITSVQNWIVYLKSGKQINEQEFERLKAEMPEITNPEPVFRARLARTKALMDEMLSNRERELAARGFRGTSPAQAPPAAAAPARPPAAAPAPQPKYQEGKRMYSPSQRRWFIIKDGVPVPE